MKRLPHTALAFLSAIAAFLSACSPAKKSAEPAGAAVAEIEKLDQAAASASFQANVQSHLDLLKLTDKVTSAIVHTKPDQGGKQIVYILEGIGTERMLEPARRRLSNKWRVVADETCWMPWDDLPGQDSVRRGVFMDAYDAGDFRLTLWIGRSATDLFICYAEPGPAETQ